VAAFAVTPPIAEAVMGLVRGGFRDTPNPTAAHRLQPATPEEFQHLGTSAIRAVSLYYSTMHHQYGDAFVAWLQQTTVLKLPELFWTLDEWRRRAPERYFTFPLDRDPYHFVPYDPKRGFPYFMVMEPSSRSSKMRWRPAAYRGMFAGDAYHRPSVDTLVDNFWLRAAGIHQSYIAKIGQFERLLQAPEFWRSWCDAAEPSEEFPADAVVTSLRRYVDKHGTRVKTPS
jgi:hypothetical protein